MCYCWFLFLCLLVFVLYVKMFLCWGHRYLQFLCLPVGFSPWSLCSVLLYLLKYSYFRVYYVWCEDCYFMFVLIFICMVYVFHPLTFSPYVFLGLKWVYFRQHLCGYCFCMHLASLCLLVGTFDSFTFKVIINIYVLIAIFLIVWGLFL